MKVTYIGYAICIYFLYKHIIIGYVYRNREGLSEDMREFFAQDAAKWFPRFAIALIVTLFIEYNYY